MPCLAQKRIISPTASYQEAGIIFVQRSMYYFDNYSLAEKQVLIIPTSLHESNIRT